MVIITAGMIGVGKTTLTGKIAEHLNTKAYYEPVGENPVLPLYYANPKQYGFLLQIYFLNKRFKEVVEISQSDKDIIQDRTIFEDACIFAPNLQGQGYMSDSDFNNYTDLFDTMMTLVKLPDLMIYIRSTVPNHINQIGKRGRECEQTIRIDYLTGLNERYEEWIKNYKGNLIIVDGDTQKFESDAEAFRRITDKIDARLFGLFK